MSRDDENIAAMAPLIADLAEEGDGWNLLMAGELRRLTPDFLLRLSDNPEPGHEPGARRRQRTELIGMIADLEELIAA